jgi:hypothetical protein
MQGTQVHLPHNLMALAAWPYIACEFQPLMTPLPFQLRHSDRPVANAEIASFDITQSRLFKSAMGQT